MYARCQEQGTDFDFLNVGMGYERANDAKAFNATQDYKTIVNQVTAGIDKDVWSVLYNGDKADMLGTYLRNPGAT